MTQPNELNQVLLHPSRLIGSDLNAWLQVGGGEGLLNALSAPDNIVKVLEDAGLCGMGGGRLSNTSQMDSDGRVAQHIRRPLRCLQCQRR